MAHFIPIGGARPSSCAIGVRVAGMDSLAGSVVGFFDSVRLSSIDAETEEDSWAGGGT